MLRSILFLLFVIFTNNRLVAQQSSAGNHLPAEKKAATVSFNPRTGFKKQSSSAAEKHTAPKKSNTVSTTIPKNAAGWDDLKNNASKTSETIKIDYNNMPADVQSKVNSNKVTGKNLLEGVAKVFTVEIKTCTTDADHKRVLSFLKAKKGFINSQFVSAGVVKIIVEPTFDSVDLKDAMLAEGIRFNFLNRSYLLKK